MKKLKIKVNLNELNPRKTFFCGQCFRWTEEESGVFSGIVRKKLITVRENGDFAEISGFTESEAREYFDLDADYAGYIKRLSADKTLKEACRRSAGIRILRQEPFETLISFIISQNNNIPRISGIITRLCEGFGERIDGGFAFPAAESLRGITAEELAPLRAGFRARYIADAVEKVNGGLIDFDEINVLSTDEARQKLKLITGVGDKVADCVLLFAFHKTDAFPKDVWVKRLMERFYPDGLPECTKGIEGVAQQYLFDYVRNNNGLSVKE